MVSTSPLTSPRTSKRSPSTATTRYCWSKIDFSGSFIGFLDAQFSVRDSHCSAAKATQEHSPAARDVSNLINSSAAQFSAQGAPNLDNNSALISQNPSAAVVKIDHLVAS